MVVSPWSRPSPPHAVQRSLMIFPSPLQFEQVLMFTNWPKTERETCRTSPDPPHTVQVMREAVDRAPLPPHVSHVFHRFTLSFFSTPVAISSSVSGRRIFRSEPGVPDCPRPRARDLPPAKTSSKMLPPKLEPKISLKLEKMSFTFVKPWKSDPWRTPSWPY